MKQKIVIYYWRERDIQVQSLSQLYVILTLQIFVKARKISIISHACMHNAAIPFLSDPSIMWATAVAIYLLFLVLAPSSFNLLAS